MTTTPNLALTQYATTDKINWVNEYNKDMLNIDTAVKEITTSLDETNEQLAQKASQAKADDIQTQVNNLVLAAGNPESSSAEIAQARSTFATVDERLSKTSISKIGKNLFDKSNIVANMYLNASTGVAFSNADTFVSNFIPVKASTSYYGKGIENTVAYDVNKNYIAKATVTTGTFTTPVGTAYIRTCAGTLGLNILQIEEGIIFTGYEPYGFTLDDSKVNESAISSSKIKSGYKVNYLEGVTAGKNIFNKNNITANMYLSASTGVAFSKVDTFVSDFIPVKASTSYYGNGIENTNAYDTNKKFISTIASTTGTFVTPVGTAYIRTCAWNTTLNTLQIEEGTSFTGYEPYELKINYLTVNKDKKVITSRLANFVYANPHNVIAVGLAGYANNQVFVNDLTDGVFRISDGQSNLINLTYPTNCNFFYKVLIFKGYIYGVGSDTVDGLWKVWRAPNNPTTTLAWEANPVWTARDTVVNVRLGSDFNCSGNYIFLGEYGSRTTNDPILWRSSDGTTWTNVLQLTNSLHIHSVNCNPNKPGSVWLCSGEEEGMIYHSNDNGTTWTKITTDYGYQSVQVSFHKKNVYIADDSTQQSGIIINEDKLIPFLIANNRHSEFGVPAATALGDQFYRNAFYGAVTDEGVYYGIIQDQSSGGNTSGVIRSLSPGEDLALIKHGIEIIPTPDGYKLLSEVFVTKDRVFFNKNWMYKAKVKSLYEVT